MATSSFTTQIPLTIEVEAEEGALLPQYSSEWAAGADLRAYLKEPFLLESGKVCAVPTGLKIALPVGYELQIRPRSGLALHHGISVLNSPGTIDADYRGELKILLINHGQKPFLVEPGMRIAQAVVAPCCRAQFLPSASLSMTQRGANGFGHTGLS